MLSLDRTVFVAHPLAQQVALTLLQIRTPIRTLLPLEYTNKSNVMGRRGGKRLTFLGFEFSSHVIVNRLSHLRIK